MCFMTLNGKLGYSIRDLLGLYQIFNYILNNSRELLLNRANSLLEWDMLIGINPIRGMLTRGGTDPVTNGFL